MSGLCLKQIYAKMSDIPDQLDNKDM
jgi:hypothetical protein